LVVRQKNVIRRDAKGQPVTRGDGSTIALTEDGQDLRQDPSTGRTNGKPALEWVVVCSECGKEYRDHPHQKLLDEAAKTAPPPMRAVAFQEVHPEIRFTSAAEAQAEMQTTSQLTRSVQLLDHRMTAIESKLDEILANQSRKQPRT
jgi:hypothetical protein